MGGIKNRLVRSTRGVLASLRQPPYVRPGHYYSPMTSRRDRLRAVAWGSVPPVGVDLDPGTQEALWAELRPYATSLVTDRWQPGLGSGASLQAGGREPSEARYHTNGMYGRGDASVLHAMLRHFEPKRVVEVGSGYSTAVMLDVAERHLPNLEVTCIEPNPERLLSRLRAGDNVELIRRPVQDVAVSEFARLEAGDFLFIDSTHVAKAGSDVIWLYLHVLPTLNPGVIVHVHDVHYPFEYPKRWLREGRDWTEVYLLRAFLTHNAAWRVLLMTDWLWSQRPELVPEALRSEGQGSLWMQRTQDHQR